MSLDLLVFSVSSVDQLLEVFGTLSWHFLLSFDFLHVDSSNGGEDFKNSVVVDQNVLLVLEHEVKTETLMAGGIL